MALVCLSVAIAYGQPITFAKLFDFYPLNGENGVEVHVVEDGYILLTSNDCVSFTTPNERCRTLTKLDEYGNVQWMLELDLKFDWTGCFIEWDNAYYVVGFDKNTPLGVPMLKISKQGHLLWKKKAIDLPFDGGATKIAVNSEGDFVILGGHLRPWVGETAWLPFVATVTPEGEEIDMFSFNDDYRGTTSYRLVTTSEGNYLTSYIYCPEPGCNGYNSTGGLMLMNPYGGVIWRKALSAVFAPYTCNVEQIGANDYVYQWYHAQYTSPQWEVHPPGLYYMNAQGVVHDSLIFHNQTGKDVLYTHAIWDKGIVGCGFQTLNKTNPNPSTWIRSGWIFRVDEHKELRWERNYADTTNSGSVNTLYHIKKTGDGGYIACGGIDNRMTGVIETHAWLLKLDSTGCLTPGCGDVNIITGVESAVFAQEAEIRCAPNPASFETYVTLPTDLPERDVIVVLLSPEGKPLHRQAYAHPGIRIPLQSAVSGMHYVAAYRQGRLLGIQKLIIVP